MFSFNGNITGVVDSPVVELPTLVENFALVNKSAATIGVNVYKVLSNNNQVCIAPLNLQIAAGEMYESERSVVVLATEKIRVSTSGSTDYDFTISNLNP